METIPTDKQLLALIRAALWQKPMDTVPFMERRADWDSIGTLAMQQTVAMLAISSAITLPEELMPPAPWLRKGYGYMERNRRTHSLMNSCLAEATEAFEAEGIETVLLKGQAYAKCYPLPELRQCGDIDLYIGEDNYRKAYEVTRRLGWESNGDFVAGAKHYACKLRGVQVELHRVVAQLPLQKAHRSMCEWSYRQLSSYSRHMDIGGVEIRVPGPLFEVVFVFMHLYQHFLTSGIGLRHLCDWVMLLHVHSAVIDSEELNSVLDRFGLLRGWRMFAPIAVEQLGLPAKECPLFDPAYRLQAYKALHLVMREGNFGRYNRVRGRRPEGYMCGKLYSLKQLTWKMMSRASIDPLNASRYYCRFLKGGMKGLSRDILKKMCRL